MAPNHRRPTWPILSILHIVGTLILIVLSQYALPILASRILWTIWLAVGELASFALIFWISLAVVTDFRRHHSVWHLASAVDCSVLLMFSAAVVLSVFVIWDPVQPSGFFTALAALPASMSFWELWSHMFFTSVHGALGVGFGLYIPNGGWVEFVVTLLNLRVGLFLLVTLALTASLLLQPGSDEHDEPATATTSSDKNPLLPARALLRFRIPHSRHRG